MCRTAEERFVPHVRLWNPFPRGSSWELQHALPALHYGCSMPIPSLYCNCRKSPSYAEKRGCQPFSYLCSQNVTQCRKEMNVTSLSTQSMFLWKSKPPLGLSRKFRIFLNLASSSLLVCKASLLWNLSVHSLPEAWGPWEGQYAPVILHCACIMPIPSLQLQKKAPASCREAKRLVTQLWSPRCFEVLVIVLSVVLWDCCKPTNTCQDWAFSNSGLEMGLPAFQLPMFAKCDALPKGDLLYMFASDIPSRRSILEFQALLPALLQVVHV